MFAVCVESTLLAQPRFHFRLQPVLEHRTRKLDEVKAAMGDIMQHHTKLKQHIDEIEGHIQETLNTPLETEQDIAHMQFLNAYLHTMRQEKEKRQHRLEHHQRIVDEYQYKLREAYQKQQVLETLKEKKRTAFHQKIARAEADQMEEIALRQYSDRLRGHAAPTV